MSRRTAAIAALALVVVAIVLVLVLRTSREKPPRASSSESESASASQLDPSSPEPIASSIRDRKTRDQVRDRIYKARGEAPPAQEGARRGAGTTSSERDNSAAPNPASPFGGSGKGPGLDPKYIQSVIREDFAPMAKQCYESALAENPKLAGKLVVFFTIVGDEKVGGIVESAEISDGTTIEDPKLRQCFTESMMTLAFKPPPKGGKVTVKYPFTMEPDDPPDGGK